MNKEQIEAIIIEEMINMFTEEGKERNVPTKMIERGLGMQMHGIKKIAERVSLKLAE
jgi:hypothetical protein